MSYGNISELVGKTLTAAVVGTDRVDFSAETGESYALYHSQDCCETVTLDEVDGDPADLVGEPILVAEERTSDAPKKDQWDESFTWTYYYIATRKGAVHLKFYGTSNGYYSEGVDFAKL